MTAVVLALAGLGVTDVLRGGRGDGARRHLVAAVVGLLVVTGLALGTGQDPGRTLVLALAAVVVLVFWVGRDIGPRSGVPAGWWLIIPIGVPVLAFVLSGQLRPIGGPVLLWYQQLGLPLVQRVPVGQFLVATAGLVYLLGTSNKVVRLVLRAAGTPPVDVQTPLKGGRWLGPLERIFVAVLMLAGDPTGAAVVVAAKGLVRLPEIRTTRSRGGAQGDHVVEYFLIGTFTSWLLALVVAALVVASG